VADAELDVEANAQVDDQTNGAEDGEGDAPPEDDTEEIEYEGQKHKLPKALAKEFREGTLRQSDYTRKTQEVAEARKALDTERQTLAQQAEARQALLDQRVSLKMLDTQLEQLSTMDWGAYAQQYGAEAAVTAMAQTQQLRDQRASLERDITAKEQEHRLQSDRVVDTALQEANQILQREVSNFGPELVGQVAEAAKSLGITPEEIRQSFVGDDGKADVRLFKGLAELTTLRAKVAEYEAKLKKTQTAEKQAAVQPAATVRANPGQYKAGLNDELPADEWMRRRNAELAKARRR
jgi:hypothetical protein